MIGILGRNGVGAQAGLAEGHGGLNIAAGKNFTAGTFFTGLIDDVRIYNRAVQP